MGAELAYTFDDAYRLLDLDSSEHHFIENYYVQRQNFQDTLITQLQLAVTPAKFLFSGHRGSGKTTQLQHVWFMVVARRR